MSLRWDIVATWPNVSSYLTLLCVGKVGKSYVQLPKIGSGPSAAIVDQLPRTQLNHPARSFCNMLRWCATRTRGYLQCGTQCMSVLFIFLVEYLVLIFSEIIRMANWEFRLKSTWAIPNEQSDMPLGVVGLQVRISGWDYLPILGPCICHHVSFSPHGWPKYRFGWVMFWLNGYFGNILNHISGSQVASTLNYCGPSTLRRSHSGILPPQLPCKGTWCHWWIMITPLLTIGKAPGHWNQNWCHAVGFTTRSTRPMNMASCHCPQMIQMWYWKRKHSHHYYTIGSIRWTDLHINCLTGHYNVYHQL